METFPALLTLCGVDSTHQGQWCGLLMFSLICAWTNGWASNRDYVEWRRHCAHYDVAVMIHNSFCFKHCARQTSSGGIINPFETIPSAMKISFIVGQFSQVLMCRVGAPCVTIPLIYTKQMSTPWMNNQTEKYRSWIKYIDILWHYWFSHNVIHTVSRLFNKI